MFNYLILLFSTFEVIRTFHKLRIEAIGIKAGIVWLALWCTIGFFGMFPEILDVVQSILQFRYRLNMILVLAVFVLLVLIFDQSSQLEKMKREEARAVQETALLQYQLKLLKNDIKTRFNSLEDRNNV